MISPPPLNNPKGKYDLKRIYRTSKGNMIDLEKMGDSLLASGKDWFCKHSFM